MTKAAMVESIFKEQSYEFGADLKNPRVHEYAELLTEDLNRKGCVPETYPGNECHGCGACANGRCPLEDWEKRHPEFADDELAKKIKALETELYGWHKQPTCKAIVIKDKTIREVIAELQQLPQDSIVTSYGIDVKLPLTVKLSR